MRDLSLKPTVGVASGETIQFALGRWPGGIGTGVALSEEAFDAIEPHLGSEWPDWTPERRYGATELPTAIGLAFAQRLRSYVESSDASAQASSEHELFLQLADWLDAHCVAQPPISILGI